MDLKSDNKHASIEGLDSASPFFTNEAVELRLDPSDADFVDTIHTDGDLLGTPQDHGHIDFHPNGGKSQPPGCSELILVGKWYIIIFQLRVYVCKLSGAFAVVQSVHNANVHPLAS